MNDSFLRLPQVCARTGLSRSTVYARMNEGSFPVPVSLGDRAVGWVENEISAWIANRIEAGRVGPGAGPRGRRAGDV